MCSKSCFYHSILKPSGTMYIFLGILLFIPVSHATCPTDVMCSQDFERCYKFVTTSLDFFQAEQHCKDLGGHLTSIRNVFENALMEDTATSMFTGFNSFWIGANNILTTSWSWTDGTQWNYVDWFPGEPGNATQMAATSTLGTGFWSVTSAISHNPFVCGLPLNYSGITSNCPVCPSQLPVTEKTCPTSSSSPPACKTPCEDGWSHFTASASCYKIVFNMTFVEAENECQKIGAHLASVHSAEENEFIADLTKTGMLMGYLTQVWIGLYRVDKDYSWTDKTKIDFTEWAAGEPNEGIEACAQIFSDSQPAGPNPPEPYLHKWNDRPCTDRMRAAVCKKPQF